MTDDGAGYGSGAAGDIYNAKLVGIGTSTTGQNATAKLTVDSSGTITSVKVMDGGSAYGIGNTVNVVGVGTTTGYTAAVLTVDQIYNNVGDVIRVVGVSSEGYSELNDLYRITSVGIGTSHISQVTVSSATTASGFSTTGVGVTLTSGAYLYQTGEAVRISAFTYNKTTGIGIVTSTNGHGFGVDQKVRLVGADETLYQGGFVITEVNDVLSTPAYSFSVNIGVGTTAPATTGTLYAYPEGFASNGGNVTVESENLNGRMVPTYAGITTSLASAIANATTTEVSLTNVGNLDVNIGDYLFIDEELVRVKTTTTGSNPLYVFRGVLGTKRTSHLVNSTVRKVFVNPIEFRRHSIIRASGHTFEYVGFGPGNYSTSLPNRQNRILSSTEKLLARSFREDSGIVVFTGMDDSGEFYIGNKKVSSATGREEVIDAPVPTVKGQDRLQDDVSVGFDVLTPLEVNVTRSLKVEGGPDNTQLSEFDGPVNFNEKVVSTSDKGLEVNSLLIQGDQTVSRRHTIGANQPTTAGTVGDIVFNANPANGGVIGWVYTSTNEWKTFGQIQS